MRLASLTHDGYIQIVDSITLIESDGVEGDVHRGKTVKHRSRVRRVPTQPNLRQVHLNHYELIMELRKKGFDVDPATMARISPRLDLISWLYLKTSFYGSQVALRSSLRGFVTHAINSMIIKRD